MPESSFPITNVGLTDRQWTAVTLGMGSGILSEGGDPYAHTARDNAANTITLSLPGGGRTYSQAVVAGFYHRIDTATTIPVPMPASGTTTYYIGLTYDPARVGSATGPVSLTCTTSVPSGSGKVYLPLHEIDRKANQLLTDAVTRDRRVYIAPTLTTKAQATLPPTTGLLAGTTCMETETGTQWRVSPSGTWVPANTPWFVPFNEMLGWSCENWTGGISVQYTASGKKLCRFQVWMRRTGIAFTQTGDWQTHGTILPPELRNGGDFWVHTFAGMSGQPGEARVNLQSGAVQTRMGLGNAVVGPWMAWSFAIEWTTW